MSIKSFASRKFSSLLLDERRHEKSRARFERQRQAAAEPHRVEFFHQVDDPYSHLLAQALTQLVDRFDVEVATWLVTPPDDWAAPARAELDSYSLVDARRLAAKAGLHPSGPAAPLPETTRRAQRRLAATLPSPTEAGRMETLQAAVELGRQLWDGGVIADPESREWPRDAGSETAEGAESQVEWQEEADDATVEAVLCAGSKRRTELGHYLGGVCWYGGEWTWGIDRLAYLEERLETLDPRRPAGGHGLAAAESDESAGVGVGGAAREGQVQQGVAVPADETAKAAAEAPSGGGVSLLGETGSPVFIYRQPELLATPVPQPPSDGENRRSLPDLHFFASFRSPYTWVSTDRVIRLAEAFGVKLRIRFVLPMVMRGLPVKRAKRVYILLDAAREAKRNGVPFGPISDPVGKPVERGYALLRWAVFRGRGIEYFRSFMSLVFSQGVDAGTDRGLRRIVEEAGLDWAEGRKHLDDPAWKDEAERNREELLDLGLWGVPSFRVGEVATWGQDRLWVLEDEYRRLLAEG